MKHTSIHTQYIVTGRLLKPFGLKGEIVFLSYSGETEHFKQVKTVYLGNSYEQKQVEYWVGLDSATSHQKKAQGKKIRCKLLHIDTPETAKDLCNQDVSIERALASPLYHQEWYISDMVSLQICCDGKYVGVIEAVSHDAFQPLLRIRWNNQKEGLIPFNKHFFSNPNTDTGSIELLNAALVDMT